MLVTWCWWRVTQTAVCLSIKPTKTKKTTITATTITTTTTIITIIKRENFHQIPYHLLKIKLKENHWMSFQKEMCYYQHKFQMIRQPKWWYIQMHRRHLFYVFKLKKSRSSFKAHLHNETHRKFKSIVKENVLSTKIFDLNVMFFTQFLWLCLLSQPLIMCGNTCLCIAIRHWLKWIGKFSLRSLTLDIFIVSSMLWSIVSLISASGMMFIYWWLARNQTWTIWMVF